MDYFESFPVTYYRFSNSDDYILLKHILRRFRFREKVKDIVGWWDNYIIMDHETPESIALSVYGDPKLHWIILLYNDIIDPFSDFPLNSDQLNKYVDEKYPDARNSIHHYTKGGRIVPQGTSGATAVSNYQFEFLVNEAKRKIRLPKSDYIRPILIEFEKILKEEA